MHCAEVEYSIWIGLYRTSAGWVRSSSCHANANNTHLSAYLTLTSIEHMVAVTINVSAFSWGREELEHCAALRADGRLTEASCSWAGFQCLCELGTETLPEYVSMADAARLSGEKRARHLRMQVATIFSLAVALPLVMDKRIARLFSLLQLSVTVAKHTPSKMEGMRTLWMHTGWAMLVVGIVPFFWQAALGTWDAAGLGSWNNFTPLLPWGTWVVYVNAPRHYLRGATVVIGLLLMAISLCALATLAFNARQAALSNEGERLANSLGPIRFSFGGIALLGFTLATVGINGSCGIWLLISAMRPDASPLVIATRVRFSGRLASGVCGTSLSLMGLGSFAYRKDPWMALQHPYAVGILTTGVSWMWFGFCPPRLLQDLPA